MHLLVLLPLALLLAGAAGGTAKARDAIQRRPASDKAKRFQAAAVKVADAAKAIATKALQAKATGKPVPKLPANAAQARAARVLCAYLREPGANWGSPTSPSPQVIAAQAAMGVPTTGFTDAATRMAIAKTGIVLPLRPTEKLPTQPPETPPYIAPAPAPVVDQVDELQKATRAFKVYLSVTPSKAWGSKGKPNQVVAAYQKRVGLTADGIYGPATRAAGARLGVELPARK